MSPILAPFLAMKIARAVACAPLIPSGWLCVHSADSFARAKTSSLVLNAHPTGEMRIAEPFPQLLYGSAFPVVTALMTYRVNPPPYPPTGQSYLLAYLT